MKKLSTYKGLLSSASPSGIRGTGWSLWILRALASIALLFVLIANLSSQVYAQSMAIGEAGLAPLPSAMLDVVSTDKGMLIPRMPQSNRNAIVSPANGLLIWQTDGETGLYTYKSSSSSWVQILDTDASVFSLDGVLANGNNANNQNILNVDSLSIGFNSPQVPLGVNDFFAIDGTNTAGLRYIGANMYYNGSDFKYISSEEAGVLAFTPDNTVLAHFESGTANANIPNLANSSITWDDSTVTLFSVASDSNILLIGQTVANRLNVNTDLTIGNYTLSPVDGNNGEALITDGSGNVSFQDPGDDLGDHTATQNIILGNRYISNNGSDSGLTADGGGIRIINNEFSITNSANTTYSEYTSFSNSNTGADFDFWTGRGTSGSPSSLLDNDNIVSFNGTGYVSGIGFTAQQPFLRVRIDGTVSSSGVPTKVGLTAYDNMGATASGIYLRADGNVGINQTTPSASLDVNGRALIDTVDVNGVYKLPSVDGTNGYALITNGSGTVSWADPGDGNGIYSGSGSLSANTTVNQGSSTLDFTTSVADGFSVDGSTFSVDGANNRVGIGTASPESSLNVSADGVPQVVVEPTSTTGQDSRITIRGARNAATTANQASILFENYDADLGSSNILGRISGRVTDASANTGDIVFYASTDGSTESEAMRIDEDGNVGINQTNPATKLHVSGSGYFHNGSTAAPSTGTVGGNGDRLILWPGASGVYPYSLGINNSEFWHSAPASAKYSWYINGAEELTLSNAGYLGISFTNPVSPLTVSTTGSTDVYINGGAATDQESVTFGYNSASNSIGQIRAGNGYFEMAAANGRDIKFLTKGSQSGTGLIEGTDVEEIMRIDGNGHVGVGTTDPKVLLHVIDGNDASLNDGSGEFLIGSESSTNIVMDDNEIMARSNGGEATLHLQNDGGDVSIHGGQGSNTEFVIKDNGDVGIGETSPQGDLDVNFNAVVGNIAIGAQSTFQGATQQAGDGYFTTPWVYATAIEAPGERGSAGTAIIVGDDDNFGDADEIHMITNGESQLMVESTGEVGIGISNPSDGVHLFSSGSIRYRSETSSTSFSGFVAENSNGEYFMGVQGTGDGNSGEFHIFQNSGSGNSGQRMVIDHNGRMGIGQGDPTHILHINGTGRSSSALWATASDARAKENIQSITDATSLIKQLRPVTFQWKEDYRASGNYKEGTNYGFISQEVETIIPDMVSEVEEVVGNDTITDFKLLDKDPLIALLVRATQEQQEHLEAVQAENQELKAQIEELTALLKHYLEVQEQLAPVTEELNAER